MTVATLYFPAGLLRYTDGLESVRINAPRVRELFETVIARYPALADHLPQMAVAIDGEIHHDADYLPLAADSEVHLVPRIAGGTGKC